MARKPGADETTYSLLNIADLGPVTAYRLSRDLDITTIREVATADLSTLEQIWGVGPIRSRKMKGSAQGYAKQMDAQLGQVKRVALVAGEDTFPDDAEVAFELIADALEVADVEVTSKTRFGYVTGEMGGDVIKRWYDYEVTFGDSRPRCQPFETPWSKYRPFCADDAGPVDLSVIDRIPFDVHREDQVEWWMAPAERTNDMVRWADEVVVVLDGQYADSFRRASEREDTPCKTAFVLEDRDGQLIRHDWTAPEDDAETFTPDEDETYTGGNGPRPGSVPDLESEHWMDGPNDRDEDRRRDTLQFDDPGGKGVGKKMDEWA